MLIKKIDRAANFIEKHPNLLGCPKCHTRFMRDNHSIRCENGHLYNLSKKGTLYFLEKKVETEYNNTMLLHRQKMIQTGMYQPMLDKLAKILIKDKSTAVLDVGCGEGSFLQLLAEKGTPGAKIGFDISKEGVELATNHPTEALWLVADLTNLPIQTNSLSHILNIFSPSHYHEFARVLKETGKVIKVIPGAYYLKELRTRVMEGTEKENYSNEKVYRKFSEEMKLISEETLHYQFEIPESHYEDFLYMSPLHWQASESKKQELRLNPIKKITIEVTILVGEVKK